MEKYSPKKPLQKRGAMEEKEARKEEKIER